MSSGIDGYSTDRSVDQSVEHADAQSDVLVSGVPYWETRELTEEYINTDQKKTGVDMPFLVITLLILMMGVIMVLSASFARGFYTTGEPMRVFMRQLVFAVSGVAIMLLVPRFSLKTLSRWSYMLLAFSVFLLVVVLFVGMEVNGAKRWLGFEGEGGSFSFQPSEVAKLALIMSCSKWICDIGRVKMKTFKYGVAPFIAISIIMVALLMMEPHISASVIVVVLAAIMIFAGGARLRWFAFGALFIAAFIGLLMIISPVDSGQENSTASMSDRFSQVRWGSGRLGYADGRIDAWLDPEADPLGHGFQIRQSLYAVGSGGLLGQGLGQSRQKYLYLPEEHNDYIFAIVCEELGFIGAMLILMLFALLVIRGFWLALNAKDKYSALVTTGIMSLLAIQVFINVAVVTNLLPSTGVSLPFFSYGGTALWIQLFQMGIVLAVSREIPQPISKGHEPGVPPAGFESR